MHFIHVYWSESLLQISYFNLYRGLRSIVESIKYDREFSIIYYLTLEIVTNSKKVQNLK